MYTGQSTKTASSFTLLRAFNIPKLVKNKHEHTSGVRLRTEECLSLLVKFEN